MYVHTPAQPRSRFVVRLQVPPGTEAYPWNNPFRCMFPLSANNLEVDSRMRLAQ